MKNGSQAEAAPSDASSSLPRIRAILFDLDNTLLDRTSAFAAFARAFVERFVDTDGNAAEWIEIMIELDEDGYKNKTAFFAELLERLPWRIKPESAELMAYYDDHYVRSAVLMDQALEVLEYARNSGCKLGMITNGRTRIQHGKIARLGLRNVFDTILVSEEVGLRKPDPAIFRLAAERLGIPAGQCVFIGDHPVNDIEGAARAGMATVWLEVNQPWREGIRARPLRKIRTLGQLLEMIRNSFASGGDHGS
ncbi:HAD family hydrolase [Paenibacillaceae bacterium WGS1546]|uniref:HAD family hydrolase n=1 Tax=Cohnella sp. WGS1546 TaxID=3366810 RepID=UPI00372D25CB